MTPAERLALQATYQAVKDAEDRATAEFRRAADENDADWLTVRRHRWVPADRGVPLSAEEFWKRFSQRREIDASQGELEGVKWAMAMIREHACTAREQGVVGTELASFLQYCTAEFIRRACKLLRPDSEDEESRRRIAGLIDLEKSTDDVSWRPPRVQPLTWDDYMEIGPQTTMKILRWNGRISTNLIPR
jgi:hypothetical protein